MSNEGERPPTPCRLSVPALWRSNAWIVFAAGLMMVGARSARADDSGGSIEISVPLRDGAVYSRLELLRQCNENLGTRHDLRQVSAAEESILSRGDRAALVCADTLGLLEAQFEHDRLTLIVPRNGNSEAARWLDRLAPPRSIAASTVSLPTDFDPHHRTVLLVHGLEANAAHLERIRTAFDRCRPPVQTLAFEYANDGPIADAGQALRDALVALEQSHPDLELSIVAHSMGGLAARWALESPGRRPQCVRSLVMVGTPHRGSNLAVAQPWLELALHALPATPHWPDLAADGSGEAARDLTPGSDFLRNLNALPRAAGIRYVSIIGRRSFLTDQDRQTVDAELRRIFITRGVATETQTALLSALHADELVDGSSDGAVSVVSARLAGVQHERVFALNHRELIDLADAPPDAGPESSELFRWILHTLGWSDAR